MLLKRKYMILKTCATFCNSSIGNLTMLQSKSTAETWHNSVKSTTYFLCSCGLEPSCQGRHSQRAPHWTCSEDILYMDRKDGVWMEVLLTERPQWKWEPIVQDQRQVNKSAHVSNVWWSLTMTLYRDCSTDIHINRCLNDLSPPKIFTLVLRIFAILNAHWTFVTSFPISGGHNWFKCLVSKDCS